MSIPPFERNELITIAVAAIATVLAGVLHAFGGPPLAIFIISGIALATAAASIGVAIEHLGTHWSPSVTGVIQSALGNLPELFIGIFALRAGLVTVVQTALIGSILANSLLVLGLAFFVGGLRNGRQTFSAEEPRAISVLLTLAVAALIIPTLAVRLHTPAGNHSQTLSVACAIVLLVVFCASIPFSFRLTSAQHDVQAARLETWPLWFTVSVLAAASIVSALVSDWFVESLKPTIKVLGISEGFTGLVIVAIAGNAVENVVGIMLAAKNRAEYAVSVILNSSLQVALALIPALVLLSLVVGGAHLTLVMPPLLVVAVGLAALLGVFVVFDGESNWLEGVALVALYGIISAAFWWG
ncbi:MAG: calcium/proton exchanger [Vulcanimicrobiaceae bacterium]